MGVKLKILAGLILAGGALVSGAPVQAEKAGTLPSFLPKNYKLVGTVKGKYVLGWNRSKFENQPEFPTLDFQTNGDAYHATAFDIQPEVTERAQWEAAHHTPFKPKAMGGGGFYQIKGFKCRGESLKFWFENGQYVIITHDNPDFACTDDGVELEDAYPGDVPTGGARDPKDWAEPVEQYKLYNFSAKYRPVAVTQGTNTVLITSDDETPLKAYQKAVTDKAFLKEWEAHYEKTH